MVLVALSIVLYAFSARRFWDGFPSSYVWTELLISYEGGFIRRGLIGEIAYLLHPFLSAQVLLSAVFFVLYVAVAVRVILLAVGNLNFPSLLFVLSPVALSFPFNDVEAYGRKDVVIIAAFLLALALVKRLRTPTQGLVAVLAIYVLVSFVHEMAVLYLPLAVAFLLHTSARDTGRRWTLGALAAMFITSAVVVGASVLFHGNAAIEIDMVAAWQERLPGAYEPLHAADYISEGIDNTLVSILGQVLALVTLAGFALCAFLGAIPVVAYALERPPQLAADPVRRRALALAAVAMGAIFLIGADWGRFIHLFWMHAFIFLASIGSAKANDAPPIPAPRTDLKSFMYLVALLVLYALAWRMGHGALRDNPFWPGYIFELQPLFRFGYGTMTMVGR